MSDVYPVRQMLFLFMPSIRCLILPTCISQIFQPWQHVLHERHPAVSLQPPLLLQRHAEAGHLVEEGPHQCTAQVPSAPITGADFRETV